jgi:hypothetical protein
LIDLAHSLFQAAKAGTRDKLKIVEKQIEYIKKSIQQLNSLLFSKQPANGQRGQQMGSQAQAQIPNGYVIGQPAPFVYDKPQVARLQKYLGVQPANGQWSNQTQMKWNQWLQKRYGGLGIAGSVGKAAGGLVRAL